MILEKQFIFIIGSPRSGTSWLRMMIAAHPMVCTTVELTTFSKYTAPWIKAWNNERDNIEQGRWHQGLPFLWGEDEFYVFLREFIKRVYERVVALNPQATHILDKHPGYSMFVEDIHWLLPGARFIHIIRDGRDVAGSMVAARENIGFGTSTIPESASAWKDHVLAARKSMQYNDQYLELKYEDLLNESNKILKSVYNFCELSVSAQDIHEIVNQHRFERMKARRQSPDKRVQMIPGHFRKGKAGSWREDINPIERFLFDEIAGDLLIELGYAKDGWWVESRIQKLTLPLLAAISSGTPRERVVRSTKVLLGPRLSGHIKAVRSRIRNEMPRTNKGTAR